MLFIPPYSCRFNAIEHLWSPIKLQVLRALNEKLLEVTEEEAMQKLILEVATTFTQERVARLIHSNAAYLEEIIGTVTEENYEAAFKQKRQ